MMRPAAAGRIINRLFIMGADMRMRFLRLAGRLVICLAMLAGLVPGSKPALHRAEAAGSADGTGPGACQPGPSRGPGPGYQVKGPLEILLFGGEPRYSASIQGKVTPAATLDDEALTALSGRFRLTTGQIRDAVARAHTLAWVRDPQAGRVTPADIDNACRNQAQHRLSSLARKLNIRYVWDDIVLPRQQLAWREMLRRLALADKRKVRVVTLPTWMIAAGMLGVWIYHELQGKEGGLDLRCFASLQTAETFIDPEISRRAPGFELDGLDDAFRKTAAACR